MGRTRVQKRNTSVAEAIAIEENRGPVPGLNPMVGITRSGVSLRLNAIWSTNGIIRGAGYGPRGH